MLYSVNEIHVPGAPDPALLYAYCQDNSPEIEKERRRPALLVIPGGGYAFTSDREAEPIALAFLPLGYNVFVLRYHVSPVCYPVPQLEAAAAAAWIRQHQQETCTDAKYLFIIGFSAGGHLAASLGILWNQEDWAKQLGVEKHLIRPDGMLLIYPVISSGEFAHHNSFKNLLGEKYEALKDSLSLENRVDSSAPPAFILHGCNDETVPVENSLLLANALRSERIPFEMHIPSVGPHGFSLANKQVYGQSWSNCDLPDLADWPLLAHRWMQRLSR